MAYHRRIWNQYPPQFLNLAKMVAISSPPIVFDGQEKPFSRSEALHFRQAFNTFRTSLRNSVYSANGSGPGSYPYQLLQILETLSVQVKSSPEDPSKWMVVFDLNPIVVEMDRLDPAAAQARKLGQATFVAAQRPKPMSEPMFPDEEMEERLKEIQGS